MKRKFVSFFSVALFVMSILFAGVSVNTNAAPSAPETPDYRGYTLDHPTDPCFDKEHVECGIRIPGPTIPAD
jgi:hypothetical protein